MKSNISHTLFIYSLTVFPCNAQITPDIALPKNSTTRLETDTTVIEGGTQAGNNLFHSFQSFSVMKGSTAFFNNTADIQNIISRVTGKSASNIDGLIRANGVANLFLINPNGIIFGPNARLDIGGSFLGSTANSINFADGFQFRATNPQAKPLLSISVPTSLQFRGNSESIRVLGTGLIIPASDFRDPLDASKFTNDGLQVNPKKTLALIGGDVLLNGGIISTKNGRIELGSVDKGEVSIRQVNNGWLFNYEKVPSFRDINLSQNSLVYVNSLEGTGNTINIQGRETRILDGSLVFSQNQSYKQNAKITINASNLLEIKDSTQLSLSAIFTSNFGKTPGEDIEIHAKNLAIEGGQIATTTFTDAPGGKVAVNADDSLKILGSPPSPVNPFGYGAINTFTYINYGDGGDIVGRIGNLILENNGVMTTASSSYGRAGDVNLLAENITIKNGSSLGSTTFNMGSGGDVFVNAKTLIEITGGSASVGASSINAATFGSGNAGKLEIYTPQMVIRDGATVSTSTVSSGNAGNITINSFNSIEVSGKDSNSMNSSSIDSSANILPESLRTRFSRVPATPTGDAGSISLYTGRLNVINGAEVSVRNDGSGNAGKLQIKSNTIDIINNGSIAATTAIGQGGDIGINSNYLQLQDGIISATAGTQSQVCFKQALLFAQSIQASDIVYKWQQQLADLYSQQGKPKEASRFYEAAISSLNQVRANLLGSNPDTQFFFGEKVEPVYRNYIRLLAADSSPNLEKIIEVNGQLQLEQLKNFLQCGKLNLVPLNNLQELSSTTAIIHIIDLDSTIEVIAQSPDHSLHHHSVDAKLIRIDINNLLGIVQSPRFSSKNQEEIISPFQKLYSFLIKPIKTSLPSSGTLVFALDTSFQSLPMDLLHDGKEFLTQQYSFTQAVGFKIQPPKSLSKKQPTALIAGLSKQCPSFNDENAPKGLKPLPGVAIEVADIKTQFTGSKVLLDEKFTSSQFHKELSKDDFPIIHISTHGQFSSNSEKTVFLAYDKVINILDFNNSIKDQSQVNENPIELLVLSACQTAKGNKRSALGMAGVAAQAGAQSVISSLWLVDESSTAMLIQEFYKGLKDGLTKAEALRLAKLSLSSNPKYEHPYFWAGFVLVGGWL